MPDRKGRFSPQEQRFIDAMAAPMDPTAAAARAGYGSPQQRGSAVMKRPEIVAAIRESVLAKLHNEGARIAVDTLCEIAADTTAPKNARVAASKVLCDMTGLAAAPGEGAKALSEMSRAELAAARDRAVAYLAELDAPQIDGTAVDVTPADGPGPGCDLVAPEGLFD